MGLSRKWVRLLTKTKKKKIPEVGHNRCLTGGLNKTYLHNFAENGTEPQLEGIGLLLQQAVSLLSTLQTQLHLRLGSEIKGERLEYENELQIPVAAIPHLFCSYTRSDS